MQKVLLELNIPARRAEALARRAHGAATTLRSELRRVETGLAARLEASEKTASDAGLSAGQVLDELRKQVAVLRAWYAAARERAETDAAGTRQAMDALRAHVDHAEQGLDTLRQVLTAYEHATVDLHDLRATVKAQGAALELVCGRQVRTDKLVEGLVEALELLQAGVVAQTEEPAPGPVRLSPAKASRW